MNEIKTYTPEQVAKIVQFHRANIIVTQIRDNQYHLDKGKHLIVGDSELGIEIDNDMAKVMKGATMGIYNEAVSLGLKQEIHDIVDFGKTST